MRFTTKPVRKCHSCLLNLGESCWLYEYPRGRWRGGKTCLAFENEKIYGEFEMWLKQPVAKTRKDLRREFFRTSGKTPPRRNDFGAGLRGKA